jgi:hypothetical protein
MRSIVSQQLRLADLGRSSSVCSRLLTALIGAGILSLSVVGVPMRAIAQSPNLSESDLKAWLAQVDTAASQRDVKATLKFYSPSFKTTDGLDVSAMEKALTQFWGRFKTIRYETQLVSWKRDGTQVIAETKTVITGVETAGDRQNKLTATLTSRQVISNQQLVSQEILSEQTQLLSGNTPPKIEIKLPEKVNPGQEFNFDAIVTEPLGNTLLLGGALEKSIGSKAYMTPDSSGEVKLEVLGAGGIFKVGEAPKTAQDFWISSFFLREGGLTLTTQRVKMPKT